MTKEFVSRFTIHDETDMIFIQGVKLSDGKIATTGRNFNGTDNMGVSFIIKMEY